MTTDADRRRYRARGITCRECGSAADCRLGDPDRRISVAFCSWHMRRDLHQHIDRLTTAAQRLHRGHDARLQRLTRGPQC